MKLVREEKFDGATRVSLCEGDTLLGFEMQLTDDKCNLLCEMDTPDREIEYDKASEISMFINQDNEALYCLFERLFSRMDSMRTFIKGDKTSRMFYPCYSVVDEIISPDRKTITWYSDDYAKNLSNYFVIEDYSDRFRVSFHTQKPVLNKEKQIGTSVHIPVIVNNNNTVRSCSNNYPFNICFLEFFDGLNELCIRTASRKEIHALSLVNKDLNN